VANVTTLDDPYRIAGSLVSLDAAFIVLYSLVAIVLMVVLYRRNARTAVPARQQEADRLATMVVSSGVALVLLVAADITEDWQLHQSLIGGGTPFELPPGIALGPLMSLLKLVFGAATVVPAGIVAVTLAVRTGSLWIAVRSARGILYGLLALVVLLKSASARTSSTTSCAPGTGGGRPGRRWPASCCPARSPARPGG